MSDVTVATEWEQSPELGELAKALAAAQGEMENAGKSKDNPFFKSKYADLAAIKSVSQAALTKNVLSVVGMNFTRGPEAGVRMMLLHGSGQFVACVCTTAPKDKGPQAMGSCWSYLRRYAKSALLDIATEDDDAESAEGRNKPAAAGGAARANTVKATSTALMANASQIQQIHILKEKIGGWTGKADHPGHPYKLALTAYKNAAGVKCESSKDLTYEQATNLIKRMQGMVDRQAETLAKAEADGHLAASVREPGDDDEPFTSETGEPADPGQLADVRAAAETRWGKKVKDLAPQWLQREFGVDSTAALSKWQASQALQMLLSGDTLA